MNDNNNNGNGRERKSKGKIEENKGVFIPASLLEIKNLPASAKIILSKIYDFQKKGKPCYLKNEKLAEWLGVSKGTVSNTISTLIRKGVIERRYIVSNKYHKIVRFLEITEEGLNLFKNRTFSKKFSNGIIQKSGKNRKKFFSKSLKIKPKVQKLNSKFKNCTAIEQERNEKFNRKIYTSINKRLSALYSNFLKFFNEENKKYIPSKNKGIPSYILPLMKMISAGGFPKHRLPNATEEPTKNIYNVLLYIQSFVKNNFLTKYSFDEKWLLDHNVDVSQIKKITRVDLFRALKKFRRLKAGDEGWMVGLRELSLSRFFYNRHTHISWFLYCLCNRVPNLKKKEEKEAEEIYENLQELENEDDDDKYYLSDEWIGEEVAESYAEAKLRDLNAEDHFPY